LFVSQPRTIVTAPTKKWNLTVLSKSQSQSQHRFLSSTTIAGIRTFATQTTTTQTTTTPTIEQQAEANYSTEHFDLLVIGAGPGGIASGRRACTYGAKVAIIEKARLGGCCINYGSVPKIVMWNAASIAETLHDMKHYGFSGYESDAISFDWNYVKVVRDGYIERLNKIYEKDMTNSGMKKILGTATFTGPREITLDDPLNGGSSNKKRFTADHILIATGGYPEVPDGEGVEEHSITSDQFFELEDLPYKAVVVGGGYIAVELTGILQALGTDTSLVLRKDRALRDFDTILSETLDEEMQRQGISLYRNTNGVKKIELMSDGLRKVTLKNGEVIDEVDVVVIASGRRPNIQALDLEVAGIETDERGFIATNDVSETSVSGVYAVGDVCGNVELTPMAITAGRRLADRLFGPVEWKDAKVSYENVPTVVFSHPPVGAIGLTEVDAKEKYGEDNVRVYRTKFANLYYGPWQVESDDKPKSAMKLVCAGEEELVVGLHVIGIGANELLQGFGVAMKMGATKADFDSCVAVHPSSSEEFVTMFPWGLSPQKSGAKHSPLNGNAPREPTIKKVLK